MIFLDIEADGLLFPWENEDNKPVSKVHCVVAKRKGETAVFLPQKYLSVWPGSFALEMLPMALTSTIVGHNIIRYDLPVLDKVLRLKAKQPVIDALLASKLLYPNLGAYSLDSFGELTGQLKAKYKPNWRNVEPDKEMVEYCIQDVNVTEALYKKLVEDGLEGFMKPLSP